MRTIVGLFVLCIFSVCVGNINAYTVPELKAEEFLQDVSEARTLSHIKKLAGFLGDDPEESLFKTLINRAVFITNDNASDAVAFTQTLRKPEWKSRFFEAYISFYGLDIEGAFSFLVFFYETDFKPGNASYIESVSTHSTADANRLQSIFNALSEKNLILHISKAESLPELQYLVLEWGKRFPQIRANDNVFERSVTLLEGKSFADLEQHLQFLPSLEARNYLLGEIARRHGIKDEVEFLSLLNLVREREPRGIWAKLEILAAGERGEFDDAWWGDDDLNLEWFQKYIAERDSLDLLQVVANAGYMIDVGPTDGLANVENLLRDTAITMVEDAAEAADFALEFGTRKGQHLFVSAYVERHRVGSTTEACILLDALETSGHGGKEAMVMIIDEAKKAGIPTQPLIDFVLNKGWGIPIEMTVSL